MPLVCSFDGYHGKDHLLRVRKGRAGARGADVVSGENGDESGGSKGTRREWHQEEYDGGRREAVHAAWSALKYWLLEASPDDLIVCRTED